MPGRFIATICIASYLLCGNSVQAQVGVPGPGFGPPPPDRSAGYAQVPVDVNGEPVRNWDGTYKYGTSRSPELHPAVQQFGPGPDGIITEEIPSLYGFNEESPFDKFVKDVVQSTWIRMEYLNWDIEEPGNVALGAPVIGVDDITQPFPITVQLTQDAAAANESARVFDLSDITLKDNNGIRGTIGIPLRIGGTIEADVFALEKRSNADDASDELPTTSAQLTRFFIATSTFLNQTPSNPQAGFNLFLYDQSFVATYTSEIFGTGVNFVLDPKVPGEGIHLQPILGFRYLYIKERLQQVGVFSSYGAVTPLTSTIDSKAQNRIYAPNVGLRSSFEHKWFTFSFEPTLGFGVNVQKNQVQTMTLRSAGDPTVTTDHTNKQFSPMIQMKFGLQIPVTENFTLHGGYDFMIVGKVTRPYESIFYNDNGPGATPDIIVNSGSSNAKYTGWTFGGEYKFR